MVDYYVKRKEDAQSQSEEEIVCYCWNIAKWKQLDVWAWKPILDETYVIVILFAITALFLPVALYIRHENQLVHEFTTRYDNVGNCSIIENSDQYPGSCEVTINIEDDMNPPVFFYYEVREFFQTHRLYLQSREEDQLTGKELSNTENCKQKSSGRDGKTLVPCGLVAYSFFNDMFKGTLETPEGRMIDLCQNCTDGQEQWADPNSWSADDIAWDWDKKKFQHKALSDDMTAWSDLSEKQNRSLPRVDNEDFIVWMRPAVSKNFRKLHRKLVYEENGIQRGLKKGDKLHVNVRTWFRVHAFNGEKHVVVSDVSRLGGQNSALWIMYLITGVSSFLAGFFFLATFYRHVSQQERTNIKLAQDHNSAGNSTVYKHNGTH